MCGSRPICRQQMHLALVTPRIGTNQRGERLLSRLSVRQQIQAGRPVQGVHQCLRRHGADTAAGVRAQSADRKELAGNSNSQATRVVACNDGPCHANNYEPMLQRLPCRSTAMALAGEHGKVL